MTSAQRVASRLCLDGLTQKTAILAIGRALHLPAISPQAVSFCLPDAALLVSPAKQANDAVETTNEHQWTRMGLGFSVVVEPRQVTFRRVFEPGAARDAAFGWIGVSACPCVVERHFYG